MDALSLHPRKAPNPPGGVWNSMARMTVSTGSCPTCGLRVQRTVSMLHGVLTEAYHCPLHGRRESSPTGMTVGEFAAPTMSTLREMVDVLAPRVGGLDWVL